MKTFIRIELGKPLRRQSPGAFTDPESGLVEKCERLRISGPEKSSYNDTSGKEYKAPSPLKSQC
jgi:hypothetical protein